MKGSSSRWMGADAGRPHRYSPPKFGPPKHPNQTNPPSPNPPKPPAAERSA
jgi:hypothetical protein